MQQLYKINTFIFSLFVFVFVTMLNNSYMTSTVIKYLIYTLDIVFLLYLLNKINFIATLRSTPELIVLLAFLTVNFIVSPYSNMALLLKYFGYIFVFLYAKNFKTVTRFSYNKWLLRLLIFVPLCMVLFLDKTPNKHVFFPNSNTFTFYGGCVALFYYIVSHNDKKRFLNSLLILIAYIAVGTSLGILVAFIVSVLILNRKNVKLMIFSGIFLLLIVYLIFNSDIEVFLRLKNQILVLTSLSWYDWTHLSDVNLYFVQQGLDLSELDRTDNTSALWRFQHWAAILDGFLKNWYYSFIFGLGDGYSQEFCTMVPHNDFLRVLAEYGGVVFIILITFIRKLFKHISDRSVLYIVWAILIYHFTENLVDAFPSNCLLYFSFGYLYYHNIDKKNCYGEPLFQHN